MSILINYNRRRNEGFSRKASRILAGLATIADRAVIGTIAGIMLLLAAYATAQYIDDKINERDLRVHKEYRERADKAESLPFTALNGGAIMVNQTHALFFDKVKETPL